MIKAVLFDLDGTLVCTKPAYRYSTTGKVLSRFGLTKSEREIDRFWFKPGRDKLLEGWGMEPERFWKAFWEHDTIHSRKKETHAFYDCRVLEDLKGMGMKLGLVTGSPLPLAQMELEMVGIEFDAVVIARPRDGITPKPHPHGILECLGMLGIRAREAVFVGNSEEDIHAAKEAKVLDILVERGEHEFRGQEPSERIKSLKDLLNLINRINKKWPRGS